MTGWVDGLEASAAALLPEAVATYIRQGSGEGLSAAEAVGAWREHRFLPRVLRDVSHVETATTVLGTPVSVPICVAPTTLQRQVHPEGEIEMGRGAAAAGTLVCVSSNAGFGFADIAASGAPWWVQAYVLEDRGLTAAMLGRAVAAGARAVVVTADTPVVATKAEGLASMWDQIPPSHLHANEDLAGTPHRSVRKAMDLTPDSIGWIASTTGLPVVVKGVLRPDDARLAVAAGAAAVWVSNHGGRQLDRSVASAEALGPVVDAVGDVCEVLVDGGLRTGLDVLAALGLGARAAFVARPAVWALAVGGSSGVVRLLDELRSELVEGLRLAGVPDVAGIGAAGIVRRGSGAPGGPDWNHPAGPGSIGRPGSG